MIEIRIHGRGGQGAVVASKVLATAVFREGKYVQSFPSFGVERRGAPVTAFTRIDDTPIRLRCQIYEPDHLVVLDPTLIVAVDVTTGLKPGGWIIINSSRPPASFNLPERFRVATVDANAIAIRHRLGPANAPIVNTAILGAFARITGLVGIEAIREAVREGVPAKQDDNVAATQEAYDEVQA
ncbi:MAG TPA: 2-oxoacid:acceptor oxidoreductase family protein [Anaerolineae bacterium]|nr:2-oxoacid:acceptor oxidoreductase family protein [Anaerolineae bacterium]HOR00695.1 2-oxoacid:acceptor oxidoreductase family protein [Anaerolineae bacterium]HPL27255.1 2-oxoacid:acceptor oxidoreductase family protein [Anaerolineae bacterium]HPL27268.1 2-oxoacid:acceptor oxidoreductase family protein [Anaerolineae bacterium]